MLIGLDISTNPKKLGLAFAEPTDDGVHVLKAQVAGSHAAALDILSTWWSHDAILAVDAPLGWPAAMGVELANHQAGRPFEADRNGLFRRHTDNVIARELGKRPLDVGADRIARAAHYALHLLDSLAKNLGQEIKLLWDCGDQGGAIEVYPAATLKARRLTSSGYKADPGLRESTLASLAEMTLEPAAKRASIASDDVFDAAVAALAGRDFQAGRCLLPDDTPLAVQEGWIWVADPSHFLGS